MAQETAIKLFESKKVRSVWDEEKESSGIFQLLMWLKF